MNRRTKHVGRISATAFGVAGGLMMLATTGQTTDGFVHTNFGSPLGVFGASEANSQSDVIAIGDGSADATELATLLDTVTTATTTAKPGPLRVSFVAGSGPNASELKVLPSTNPAAAAISDQALALPNKPVVDAQGRIDCTGSTSCLTDPSTNITTVTYADGIVALVQKINDTTVVAYKTVTNSLPAQLQNLFPTVPAPAPVPMAAAAVPATAAGTEAAPATGTPAATDSSATADSSAAALPDITAATIRPRLIVTSPPADYSPGKTGSVSGNPLQLPQNITNPVDVVKDAVGSVMSAIGGVVNDALKPGDHNGSRTKSPSPSSATS